MIILEIFEGKLARAQLKIPQALHALRVVFQALIEVARRCGGIEHTLDYAVANFTELVVDLLIPLCVTWRIRGDRVAGFVNVLIHHDAIPFVFVGVASNLVFRPDIFKSVLLKFRPQLLEVGVEMDPYMR